MTLYKLLDAEWWYVERDVSFRKDNTCWLGDTTTSVAIYQPAPIIFGWFEKDDIYFITVNRSIYKVVK